MASPSPLATPLAWDLVAPGYTADNVEHFEKYAADGLALAALAMGESVLDVATGPGSLALQAAARASEVHALDFSPRMLDALRERVAARALANVHGVQGDGQALPYADARFDAAFSMFGLIFFPDRAAGFRELHRVLKPGGRAVVASWQPMGQIPLLVEVFSALAEALPGVPFGDGKGPLSDPEEFRAELEQAGFSVRIEARTHGFAMPDVHALWASMLRGNAPLVLLAHKLGPEAFAPIAARIEARLHERWQGPVVVDMPAWLALGTKG
jgi:ubiquinone/menaquinone biosynthesis C-methylase UbiE